jgi:hypothetical protein
MCLLSTVYQGASPMATLSPVLKQAMPVLVARGHGL